MNVSEDTRQFRVV